MTRFVPDSYTRRAAGAAALFAALALLSGCAGPKPTGKVTGKVSYKGKALTTGSVNFMSDQGHADQAKLDGSGNFAFSAPMPVGTYKVYVSPPTPEQLEPGKMPTKKEPFDVLPKFQDPGQTPIKKEVKAGDNNIPVDIE